MSRVRPALAALVLVVATAATGLAATGALSAPAQPGDDPTVGVSENTSRVLLLTRADAAGFDSPNLTVTQSVDAGHQGLTTTYRLERLESQLEGVDSGAKRSALIQREVEWATNRTTALIEREREARNAYAAGDITGSEYLTTVGAVHAAASSLERYLGDKSSQRALYTLADQKSPISRTRARLQSVLGPVRERATAAVQGDRERARIHVTVGDGVMLSTLNGTTYVRETYRPDNLDEELAAYGDPIAFIQETYPWVANNSQGASYTTMGNYAVLFSTGHSHGELEVYSDVSTDRVYVERQRKRLDRMPVSYESSTSGNNATLLVSRTYTGGPVNVRVENATGGGIAAPVTLAGSEVGATGEDGELWAISPGGEYEVSVEVDGETLNATVVANPQPPTEQTTGNVTVGET
ncbi:DUF7096 domain-containing protein [Halobacterium jilantaiense]|uniref:Uncharacterized protein n=1 Tax=Halobacterium jilantaiense TaxID=355548 RepID=A0A1I0PZA4_9EURY|nr:hypothetical protein [Halobacterium jilantaiense]SEW20026.1 hypothetical protein SAMN04487945_2126 [Halobacterium jilantaiense]